MEKNKYTITLKDGEEIVLHSAEDLINEVVELRESDGGTYGNAIDGVTDQSLSLKGALNYIIVSPDYDVKVEPLGLTVKIELNGYTMTDIELALEEAKRLILAGNELGTEQNETGSYNIDVDGEELETVLAPLSESKIERLIQGHDLGVDKTLTVINYPKKDEYTPFYRIEVSTENDGETVDVIILDGVRHLEGEEIEVQPPVWFDVESSAPR